MGEHDVRVDAAVREASAFRKQLTRRLIGGQFIMLIVLSAMAYFDVSIKWMIVVGLFLAVGIICDFIEEIGARLDTGRSYLEQWAMDSEAELHNRTL
jgi:hypothetical protein